MGELAANLAPGSGAFDESLAIANLKNFLHTSYSRSILRMVRAPRDQAHVVACVVVPWSFTGE